MTGTIYGIVAGYDGSPGGGQALRSAASPALCALPGRGRPPGLCLDDHGALGRRLRPYAGRHLDHARLQPQARGRMHSIKPVMVAVVGDAR